MQPSAATCMSKSFLLESIYHYASYFDTATHGTKIIVYSSFDIAKYSSFSCFSWI